MSAPDPAATLRSAAESFRAGRLEEAEATLRALLDRDPGNAGADFQLGVIALARGRPEEAEPPLRRAAEGSGNAAASLALADALERLGRLAEAEARLRETVARDAGLVEGWSRLAGLLEARGAHDEALWALAAATRLAPRDARLWNNVAAVQLAANRLAQAKDAARRALAIAPAHALATLNLARVLGAEGDDAAAEEMLRVLLAREPAFSEARHWLAVALARRGRWTEALGAYRQAAAQRPAWAEPRIGEGNALLKLARRREAVAAFGQAAALDPARAAAIGSQQLFAMQYGDEFSAEERFAAHRAWAARHAAAAARGEPPPFPSGRRIRIGYVSPRFQLSSMAFALLPVLARHDRDRFEIFCYAEREAADEVGEEFRRLAEHWRETQALGDEAMASAIRSDGIDLLVDLAGHTPGNRLPVFARRPATAALSWLDYFDTTGVEAIDAIVGDDVTLAAPLAQRFVETPVSVGPIRYPYAAPAYAPAVAPPPALAGERATFASFARLAKITEAALDAWAGVLARVDGSRLVLKNDSLGDPALAPALREAFSRRGIDPARVELRPGGGHERMLSELSGVDIVLDTFPYNGGITTLEALWMGRPVVTLVGESLIGRQGAAILAAAGLAELVAGDAAGYVERAVALARDPARLAALSAGLRGRVAASALGDVEGFTRRLEAVYLRVLAARSRTSP